MAESNFAVIDGFRALTHLSLIALHVAMTTTAHLPSSGDLWNSFKSNPVYTFFQAGGTQVDIMFMLSAFLLTTKMLRQNEPLSLIGFTLHRIWRLLPPIFVVSIIALLIGDTWDLDDPSNPHYDCGEDCGAPLWQRFGSTWAFITNYLPVERYGSFTLSLCWSCCVDVQAGILIVILAKLIRKMTLPANSTSTKTPFDQVFALHLRIAFMVWLVLSVCTRAVIFEENTLNIFRLKEISHFGVLMTNSSYRWLAEHFGHVWRTTNSGQALARTYMRHLYMPTHSRSGPFAVGGLLACQHHLAACRRRGGDDRAPAPARSTGVGALPPSPRGWAGTAAGTLLAGALLLVPCLPAGDAAPLPAQRAATAALRELSAAAAAFLLYRALLPADHPQHSRVLAGFLGHRRWAPVAALSYCSYLVHFRVLLELNLRTPVRGLIAGGRPLCSAADWAAYLPTLWVVGTLVSLALSWPLHRFVEVPCRGLWAPSKGYPVAKKVV